MDILDVDDLTTDELATVLDRAAAIKADHGEGSTSDLLDQQTLGMIFEKPSTRTRVSFETGMTQLGGHAVFLGPDDIHLGHGEPVKDTARALGRYVDFIMARVFDHTDAEELAEYAEVPVITRDITRGVTSPRPTTPTQNGMENTEFSDSTVRWLAMQLPRPARTL